MSDIEFYSQLRLLGTLMGYITAVLFLMWAVHSVVKLWLESMKEASRQKGETYVEEYNKAQRDREVLKYKSDQLEYEKKYGKYEPKAGDGPMFYR